MIHRSSSGGRLEDTIPWPCLRFDYKLSGLLADQEGGEWSRGKKDLDRNRNASFDRRIYT